MPENIFYLISIYLQQPQHHFATTTSSVPRLLSFHLLQFLISYTHCLLNNVNYLWNFFCTSFKCYYYCIIDMTAYRNTPYFSPSSRPGPLFPNPAHSTNVSSNFSLS